LQQYLNEKAYQSASLGETSADELVLRASDKEVDFYQDSDVAKRYKE
jgi:hypothetical protein